MANSGTSASCTAAQYETCNIFYPREVLASLGGFAVRCGCGHVHRPATAHFKNPGP
jgi:hypothetical protein